MRVGVRVIHHPLGIDDQFLDQVLLTKQTQGVVDRGTGNLGRPLTHHGKHLVGREMHRLCQQHPSNFKALQRHRHSGGAQAIGCNTGGECVHLSRKRY
ncbi:hypothetical protein SDC9_143946 [bioreactor metagenome]|uniref:Uncharacterized protein n=1 Tax=bioreactor metagenome TaxID=1076179 RepID=A0A645E5D0_9ZZZZ